MHGAAIEARGLDAVYVALECAKSSFGGLLRGLALAGGGGNVTLPHKAEAAGRVDRPSPEVERTGACNTFWSQDGLVYGDNTDVAGFRGAASRLVPAGLRGTTVLLVGAGGAARAALCGLIDDGVGEVWVMNRSAERARRLVDRLGGGRASVLDDVRALEGGSVDLVVQATPLGLSATDPLPFDLERGPRVAALLDLVYSRDSTPLVEAAAAMGIPAADGREMLVLQGAEAFRRWFGDPVPVDEMRRALSRA
jgi:shikimate dehydrogenase